ncbi:LutC/YkgG family protein [Cellulomonas endophytica]|uniref:LutC/YkgG family protein n=1 Tax=Cellulomonas endophytica TaxID=2494735 RepID=UPI0010110D39|nr:lactate utilization protein C [Cellulomonas endophytica]
MSAPDARTEVLARVRAALATTGAATRPGPGPGGGASAGPLPHDDGPGTDGHVPADLRDPHAPGPVPREYRRADRSAPVTPGRLDLFVERLEDYRARVVRVDEGGLRAALVAELRDAGPVAVPPGLPGPWVQALQEEGLELLVDHPDRPLTPAQLDGAGAVLTAARVGIAETGTVVLDAEPDQGRRVLTLLPDRHVCVVLAAQVVADVPTAVDLLGEHPERPMTWISGPSATSDIELVRVEGVHGPRDLRVLVVEA